MVVPHFDRLDVVPLLGVMVRCHSGRHCWMCGAMVRCDCRVPCGEVPLLGAIAGCNRWGVVMAHFDRLDVVPSDRVPW